MLLTVVMLLAAIAGLVGAGAGTAAATTLTSTSGTSSTSSTPAYAGSASAQLLNVNALDVPGLFDAANLAVAPSSVAVSSTGTLPNGATSTASASNMSLNLLSGLLSLNNLIVGASQSAPPDNATATTKSLLSIPQNPILDGSIASASAHARSVSAIGCPTVDSPIATASDSIAQASAVNGFLPGVGSLISLNPTVSSNSQVELTAGSSSTSDGLRSTASSQLTSVTLFGGSIFQITVGVVAAPTLTVAATGRAGGATVQFNAPVLSVKGFWGNTLGILDAANPSLDLPFGVGTISIGAITNQSTSADGTQASASASLFTLRIGGPGTWVPIATVASVSISPLQASATVPSGGIDCSGTPTSTTTTTKTTPAHTSITLGQSNTDSAVVTGNATHGDPTGTVAFSVCGPDSSQPTGSSVCTSAGTAVGSPVNLTAGAGDTATATSASFTPTKSGWYCFAATYAPTKSTTSSSSGSGSSSGDDDWSDTGDSSSSSTSGTWGFSSDGSGTSTGSTWGSGSSSGSTWGWPSGSLTNLFGWGSGTSTSTGTTSSGTTSWGTDDSDDSSEGSTTTTTTTPGSPYQGSSDQSSGECFVVVAPGTTTTTVTTPAHSTIVLGQSNSDNAVVTGSSTNGAPTGTVSFSVCGPSATQPTGTSVCTSAGTAVGTAATLTAGTGDSSTASSASFTPTATGWYCFSAVYNPATASTSGGSGSGTSSGSGDDNGDDDYPNSGNNLSQDGDPTNDTTGTGTHQTSTSTSTGDNWGSTDGTVAEGSSTSSSTWTTDGNWQWNWGWSWGNFGGQWKWGWGWGWCWHGSGTAPTTPTTLPGSPYQTSADDSAGECFKVVSGAGFQVTKSVSATSVTAGQSAPVTYTLTAKNTGGAASTAPVTVTDTAPAGTTLVGGTAACPTIAPFVTGVAPCTVSVSGSTITWTIAAGVPAGASVSVSFEVNVSASASGSISNTGHWTGPGCSTAAPGCPTNTTSTPVGSGAAFTVAKSVSATSVTAGQSAPVTYTLTATNTGTSASAAPVTVTDTVPAGTTLVSGSPACGSTSAATCAVSVSGSTITWTIGAGVPVNASVSVSFEVNVSASASGSISNTGHWTGPGCSTAAPGCPTNTTSTPVTNNSGFDLIETSTPATVTAGTPIDLTYTVMAKNTGSSVSNGPVTVTDTIPAGTTLASEACGTAPTGVTCTASATATTVTWLIGAGVPAGQSVPLTFAVTADQSTAAGPITNAASWTGPGCAGSTPCTSNTVDNYISTMIVALSSNPANVTAGQTGPVTYTLTPVYDSPAGTASSGTLTVTASAPQYTTLIQTSPSCGTLTSSTTPTCTVSYDSSTGVITWIIGPGIANGSGPSVTYQVTVNADTPNGTNIQNAGDYNYSGDDPSTNPVQTGVTNNAAFTVTKAVSASTITAGSSTPLTYTLEMQNTGVSTSTTTASVSDTVPAGTTLVAGSAACPAADNGVTVPCTVKVTTTSSGTSITWDIGAGITGGESFALTFKVDVAASTTGTLQNQAQWTGVGCTPTGSATSCDTNPVTTTVNSPAAFTVTKLVSASVATAGQATPLTYTLVAQNQGLSASSGDVTITDTVPTGTTYVTGSAKCVSSSVSCTASEAGGVVTWAIGSGIPGGGTVDVSFAVTVDSSATGQISNVASWTGPGCTTAGGCPSTTVVTTLTSPATLTAVKLAGAATVSAGQAAPLPYTIVVTNTGMSPTQVPVTVTDQVPTGTTYTAGSATCGSSTPSCTGSESGGTVTWTIGAGITPGQSIDLTFSVAVPATTTGEIANTAAWSGPGCSPAGTATTCPTNTVQTYSNGPAGITVTKQVSASVASPGQSTPLTYTLVVQNGGLSTSTAPVTVTDAAPTGTTLVSSSWTCPGSLGASSCTVSETGGTITWTIGAGLAPSQTLDLTFKVTVDASATGQITNVASWSGPGCTPATGSTTCPSTPVTTLVNPPAGFTVFKQASSATVTAGQAAPLTYTLTVQNTGPSASTGDVVVTDAAPAGTTYVAKSATCPTTSGATCTVVVGTGSDPTITWTIGPGVVAGGSLQLTFAVAVSSTATGVITNTAQWTGPGCTPATGQTTCPSTPVTTQVINASTVTVTKTVSATSVTAGQAAPLTYTLTVDNAGSSATVTPIVVVDSAPTGTALIASSPSCGTLAAAACSFTVSGSTVTWTIAPGLAAAASDALSFKVSILPSATGTIANTAVYTGPGCTVSIGCGTNTTTTTVANGAQFTVSKSASATSVTAGQSAPLTYTIAVDNTGLSTSSSSVVVQDAAPAGTTLLGSSPSCGALTAGTTPSCSVVVDSTGTITWTIGAGVAPGQVVDVTFSVAIPASTTSATVTNVAQWSGPGCTPTTGATCPTVPVVTTVTNGADVTVTKSASPSPVVAGTDLTYTLTVDNTGTSVSDAPVSVVDAAPTGTTLVAGSQSCGTAGAGTTPTCSVAVSGTGLITWSIGDGLAPGQTIALTFMVTVPASATGSITNTGSYTGPGCTPVSVSSSCSTNPVTTPVTNAAAVTVQKSVSATTVTAGQATPLTYTLAVTNTGKSNTVGAVTVIDSVPTGTVLSGSPGCGTLASSACSVNVSGGTITWDLAAGLTPGQVVDLTFSVSVDATATAPIVNTATWTGPGCTTAGGCSSNQVTTTVTNGAAFSVVKSAPTSVVAGQATPLTYTLTVKNTGPSASTGTLTVTDAAPGQTTLAAGTASCGSLTGSTVSCSVVVSGSTVTWTIGAGVAPGQSFTLTFGVDVASTASGSITNTAAWGGPGCATTGVSCSSNQVTTGVSNGASFTVVGSSTPATVSVGGTTPISYTLAVTNSGPSASTQPVTVTEALPTGAQQLDLVAGSQACPAISGGVTCSVVVTGSTITWTIGAGVAPGQVIDLKFQAGADANDSPGQVVQTATFAGPGCTGTCNSNGVLNYISEMTVSLASNPANVTAGSGIPVIYTLSATYDSPAGTASSGILTITATAPSGTVLDTSSPSCGTLSATVAPTCSVAYDATTGVITWTIGPGVAAGATLNVTYEVNVDPGTPNGTTITNQANYTYSGDDPSTNPTTTGVKNNATFGPTVTKSATPASVLAGSTTPIVYTITATNGGASTSSSSLVIVDAVPTGTTYVAGSATCGTLTGTTTCSVVVTGTTITWTIDKVPGGASVSVGFDVTVNAATGSKGVSNTATWTGPGCTPAAGAVACDSTTVTTTTTTSVPTPNPVPSASWTWTKAGSPTSIAAGSTSPITYTLDGTNSGTGATTGATVVTDSAPAGTSLVAGSATCGSLSATSTPSCTISVTGSTVTWTIAAGLAAGASVDLSFEVRLAATAAAGTVITNTATWTGAGCTTTGGCPFTVTTPTTVTGAAVVAVVKSANPTSVTAGAGTDATFTMAVTNTGTASTATPTVVTDAAPTGTSYLAGSASCGSLSSTSTPSCSVVVSGSSLTWTIGAGLAAGATVNLSFRVGVDAIVAAGTTITNTATWTGAGCASAGGCPSTTAAISVNPGPVTQVLTSTPPPVTTVAPAPAPVIEASQGAAPIVGATTVHTGEPWAGSGRLVALLAGLGGLLILAGGVRRRRVVRAR